MVSDLAEMQIAPYENAHPLPLSCFDRVTGRISPVIASRHGFDVSGKRPNQVQAYETRAKDMRDNMRRQGCIDFDQARDVALERLQQPELSERIGVALAGRFVEVIVDEAQDCNPDDLKIIAWLRSTGIPVKVVCDPHQSIYEFRGGVTDHLFAFEGTFAASERMSLTGNFRSSPNIAKAIAQIRPLATRGEADVSTGSLRDDTTPVRIMSYAGRAVPPSIGTAFCQFVGQSALAIADCPVLAATKASGAAAVGQPRSGGRRDLIVRLAEAITDFHHAAGFDSIRAALDGVHEIILDLEGRLVGTSYRRYLSDNEIEPAQWRPGIIAIIRELRYDPAKHQDPRSWHAAAKATLGIRITVAGGTSISQKLRWSAGVEEALAATPGDGAVSRTIHSVKGMEFPAVCVVTTASSLRAILDFLETGSPPETAEEARKLYVAASRAQSLLVIAAPRSQAERLGTHLRVLGAEVTVSDI